MIRFHMYYDYKIERKFPLHYKYNSFRVGVRGLRSVPVVEIKPYFVWKNNPFNYCKLSWHVSIYSECIYFIDEFFFMFVVLELISSINCKNMNENLIIYLFRWMVQPRRWKILYGLRQFWTEYWEWKGKLIGHSKIVKKWKRNERMKWTEQDK